MQKENQHFGVSEGKKIRLILVLKENIKMQWNT